MPKKSRKLSSSPRKMIRKPDKQSKRELQFREMPSSLRKSSKALPIRPLGSAITMGTPTSNLIPISGLLATLAVHDGNCGVNVGAGAAYFEEGGGAQGGELFGHGIQAASALARCPRSKFSISASKNASSKLCAAFSRGSQCV